MLDELKKLIANILERDSGASLNSGYLAAKIVAELPAYAAALQAGSRTELVKVDNGAYFFLEKHIFLLIDDTCYTFFKANAAGDEGKIICIMEDAYGRRGMNCYTTDELKQKFPGAAEQILTFIRDKT